VAAVVIVIFCSWIKKEGCFFVLLKWTTADDLRKCAVLSWYVGLSAWLLWLLYSLVAGLAEAVIVFL
jgi:hypothetical protein